MVKNKYCSIETLRNEADVEQKFICRLLSDLGYQDSQILPKNSLDALQIQMRGHAKAKYKPDFGLRINRKVRWVIEAKAPTEPLDEHEWQPRAYCVLLNGAKAGDRPVRYYLLTNGEQTRLYDPDINDPLIRLRFSDFVAGNKKFEKLREFIERSKILDETPTENVPKLKLEKKSLAEVNAAFAWCHQHIYRKDNISQSDAFSEFVKLIALKLISDRAIRDKYPSINEDNYIEVPLSEVTFSLPFIELHERSSSNPINDILFKPEFTHEAQRGLGYL